MNLAELLLDPLQYGFMVRALAVAVVAAIVCAVLSCWLVLIGWSLMGDAVSHAVLPGVVLAYVVGAPFAIGALIFGLIAVALTQVPLRGIEIARARKAAEKANGKPVILMDHGDNVMSGGTCDTIDVLRAALLPRRARAVGVRPGVPDAEASA